MKKILAILLSIATVSVSTAVLADNAEKNIDVFTNYVNIQIDSEDKNVRNFLNDGTTYIALRDVSELLSCSVEWDDARKTAVISTDKASEMPEVVQELTPTAEESIAVLENYVNVEIDGEKKDVRNFLHDGTTYIALRDVSELLNCYVSWVDTTKTAVIISEPAIVVNGTPISAAEYANLYDAVEYYYSSSMSEEEKVSLTNTELIAQVISKHKAEELKVYDPTEIEAEALADISSMDAAYGAEAVDEMLAYNGYTRDAYIEEIVIHLRNKALYEYMQKTYPEYKEAEDDAKTYYDQNKESYKQHGVQVKHILIPTTDEEGQPLPDAEQKEIRKEAEAIAKKATSKNFDSLLAENNNDPGQSAEGYYVTNDATFVPEFEVASLALKKGEVSKPVKTDYGYHIILATEVYEYLPYDMFLEDYLAEKWGEIDMLYINRWISEADVVYNNEVINSISR